MRKPNTDVFLKIQLADSHLLYFEWDGGVSSLMFGFSYEDYENLEGGGVIFRQEPIAGIVMWFSLVEATSICRKET